MNAIRLKNDCGAKQTGLKPQINGRQVGINWSKLTRGLTTKNNMKKHSSNTKLQQNTKKSR